MASLITDFTYKKKLKFDTATIGVATAQANFPVCVHINTSSWPTQAERDAFFGAYNVGGKRIQFFDSNETTNLDYEVELYALSLQEAIYWVRVPQVDGNSDADYIWVAYGNDPNGSNQDNPTTVWDSDFKMVQHCSLTWEREGVVLSATLPAEEDNVFEPTVIYEGNPEILTEETYVFKMWYCYGWDNPNVGYAESANGTNWTKYTSNPVIADRYRANVFKDGSTYYCTCAVENMAQIDLYSSADGVDWSLDTAAIIEKGTDPDWDYVYIANSFVWKEGSSDWKMLYEGRNNLSIWYTGLATASSVSGLWTKSGSNPVVTTYGGGPGDVRKVGSTYHFWTWGKEDGGRLPMDLYRHTSSNLTNWTPYLTVSIFPRATADEGANTAVGQVVDATLLEHDNKVYMYYAASADGTQQSGNFCIKLAIADMPIEALVSTNENAIVDSTDNAYKGTSTAPIGATGRVGYCRSYDGVDDKVSLGDILDLTAATAFTMESLVKTASNTTTRGILGKLLSIPTWWGWTTYVDPAHKFVFGTYSNSVWKDAHSDGAVDDDAWHHLVGTRTSAGLLTVYVDSAVQAATDTQNANCSNAGALRIGTPYSTSEISFIPGLIDEVRVSQSLRSTDWIKLTHYSILKTNFNGDSWLTWDAAIGEARIPRPPAYGLDPMIY